MTYSFTVDDPVGEKVVSFDPTSLTFTFGFSGEMSLAGDTYTDYTITITATAGVNSATGAADNTQVKSFILRVKNPCTDPDAVSIRAPQSSPSYNTYKLSSYSVQDPMWISEHKPFEYEIGKYDLDMDIVRVCGELVYSATFDGAVADESTLPDMMYDRTNHSFGIYCEDPNQVGEKKLTVKAHSALYPSVSSDMWYDYIVIVSQDGCSG